MGKISSSRRTGPILRRVPPRRRPRLMSSIVRRCDGSAPATSGIEQRTSSSNSAAAVCRAVVILVLLSARCKHLGSMPMPCGSSAKSSRTIRGATAISMRCSAAEGHGSTTSVERSCDARVRNADTGALSSFLC
eukprot:4283592-Prymnesium_polylepis.2